MAKSTTNATPICIVLSILTLVGIILGIANRNPLWVLFTMLPSLVYEVYRTQEGASTKSSSVILLVVIILEVLLIIFNVNLNLAEFFGEEEKYIAGYYVPLGDIKVFGPILTAVLSGVLIFRTYGKYTKWLSILICVGSLAAIQLISPEFFKTAVK
ncbi:MAG: hypothetical protein WAX66_01765, partial [Patescibacteria group bacterium]